jgi:hypothetical protein
VDRLNGREATSDLRAMRDGAEASSDTLGRWRPS